MAYPYPIYSSANPAVDQLFGREFGAYRGEQQANQEAAKNEIIRQQIQAQSQLAQAQQRANIEQQQYSNLFREREFQSREKGDAERQAALERQLNIAQQNADTEKAWKVPRTDLEGERRKQAIIDANSNAVNDAARANALHQINLDGLVAAAKKALPMNAGLFGGTTAADLDNPAHPVRRALAKQSFDTVRSQLLAEKGGALNSLVPDPDTFTFKPVQYDETGKAIALPLPSATPSNAGAAAALGVSAAPAAVAPNPAALGTAPVVAPQASPSYFDRLFFGAGSVMPAPAAETVTLSAPGGQGVVHLPKVLAVDLRAKLDAMPAEQRAPFYEQYLRDAITNKTGVFMLNPPTATEALPNYNRY